MATAEIFASRFQTAGVLLLVRYLIAFVIAAQMRAGEYGKSRWWMPSSRRASITALASVESRCRSWRREDVGLRHRTPALGLLNDDGLGADEFGLELGIAVL